MTSTNFLLVYFVTETITSISDSINKCIVNVIFLHVALIARFILGCKRARLGRAHYSNTHYSGSLLKCSFKASLSYVAPH